MPLLDGFDVAAASDPFSVPDGTYIGRVSDCEVKEQSNKEGYFGLRINFDIIEPVEHAGKSFSQYNTLPNRYMDEATVKRTLGFLKRTMTSLGVPEDKMNTIEPPELEGLLVKATLKTKGAYQNIQTMIPADENESAGSTASTGNGGGFDI